MRPLDKGPCPQDATGSDIVVSDYDHWRKHLVDRIGDYCSYCNMPLSHSLQVEHVVPKDPPPGYSPGDPLAWSNLLLACGPCNRTKWNQPTDRATYYLPEEHNTALPFQTAIAATNPHAAIKIVRTGMTQVQIDKAQATITLLGLDNIDTRPNIVDLRWKKRHAALLTIEAAYQLYIAVKTQQPADIPRQARNVAMQSITSGFFNLWYDRFHNEPEVMQALIDPTIVPGTAQNCFDPTNGYRLVPRNLGDPTDET